MSSWLASARSLLIGKPARTVLEVADWPSIQVWLFMVAPLLGGLAAALLGGILTADRVGTAASHAGPKA